MKSKFISPCTNGCKMCQSLQESFPESTFKSTGEFRVLHCLVLCTLINTGEGSVSRENRKQQPSAFRAAQSHRLSRTWSKLHFENQGQCTLIVLSRALLCEDGQSDQASPTVLLFQCGIPVLFFFFCLLCFVFFPPTTKKSQIRDGDVGNELGGKPKWGGAQHVESGRSTDPSTDDAVCN